MSEVLANSQLDFLVSRRLPYNYGVPAFTRIVVGGKGNDKGKGKGNGKPYKGKGKGKEKSKSCYKGKHGF